MLYKDVKVVKKDGTHEDFDPQKIINAVDKSAYRALSPLTKEDKEKILKFVEDYIGNYNREEITVPQMHNLVESALEGIKPEVAKSYRDYRNYKTDFVEMINSIYKKAQSVMYIGDKENANSDSALVSTKRSLIFNELNKELYQKFFMTVDELQACREGYIYVHDMSARRDSFNCFRRDTKFITSEGVKSFYDFLDGDAVTVMTHTGEWKNAVVHKYGRQPIQKVTFVKGTHTSKEKVVYCTPNHRWMLRDGSVTDSLKEGDVLWSIPDTTKIDWDNMSLENKKLWCKGFAKGDGHVEKTPGAYLKRKITIIRLCGHKSEYAQRFIDAGYTVTNIKYPNSNENDLTAYMLDSQTKDIPWFKLNYTNVLYYVNGLMCADGERRLKPNSKSEFRGIQVTGKLNKYMYDLLNMSGYFVTAVRDLTGMVTNYGKRTDETYHYSVGTNQEGKSAWRVKSIEESTLNPKSEVWCLEVEDNHSFVLDGGIPTKNCSLADIKSILEGGFEMGNVWYNEPKSLDTVFDVISDVVLATASQQYGGFTVPRVDEILSKYAKFSFDKYLEKGKEDYCEIAGKPIEELTESELSSLEAQADKKVERDMEQGFQGWEYKFNTVSSSRGDYPFTTITVGVGTDKYAKMATRACLKVRKNGQGAPGKKRIVLFPKIVFAYTDDLHGEGKVNEDLFLYAVECSKKAMYPDYLSLDGDTTLSEMWHKYGLIIAPMGCRAFLSPYYERGGFEPADEDDRPVFTGRFNAGVVSLNLPMILAKSRKESRDFYEVLDYYMQMIRGLHKRTRDYLGELRASVNPLMFCEGGAYRGHLKPSDKIKPLLDYVTFSYGITALNELNRLFNGKSIREDGEFPLQVMQYINDKLKEYKKEDHMLYAVYGTPAESLCGLQVTQFRRLYGIVENVSDREYVSNSFHCHVSEDMDGIEKQDKEARFWNLFAGGRIQYVKYPINYNTKGMITYIRRAMQMGLYEGVNLNLSYCANCGHEELDMDECPKCHSRDLVKIDRMNGYLAYSRVHGYSRLNDAKMAEIKDRKSM